MSDKFRINKEQVVPLLETKFIKVYDLQYAPGKHYYDATRRDLQDLTAIKTDREVKAMLPDAVSCVVVIKVKNQPEKILFSMEFRYPAGQYLLSVPRGLIDKEGMGKDDAIIKTAVRELQEETGLKVNPNDTVKIINPFLYSTPGMTDESNALVYIKLNVDNLSNLTQAGARGSEKFDGFVLLTKEQAKEILKTGRDPYGNFYSVYTQAALMYFVAGLGED